MLMLSNNFRKFGVKIGEPMSPELQLIAFFFNFHLIDLPVRYWCFLVKLKENKNPHEHATGNPVQ